MNLVFGQRERKEIGARTKRAMEEMALEKIHPSKAPIAINLSIFFDLISASNLCISGLIKSFPE